MFLDCFPLGLLWKKPDLPTIRNKVLTGQTQLIKHDLRVFFEQQVFPLSFSPLCLGILNFDRANLNFAALSLTVILEVFNTLIQLIFSVVYATITVGVSGSQRGDNFCFDWSFCHHRCQSISVGVDRRKRQDNGLVAGALFFLHPSPCDSRLSLTKCHVRLVWLIKR